MAKRAVLLTLLLTVFGLSSAAAQPKVLAELFTNTNCGNCRVPEEAFESFVNAHPQYGVVRIVYHNEITNNDDVFYVPAKPDVDSREQKYGLNANPLAIIDGFPLGNNESTWESTVAAAATQSFPVQVAITTTPQLDNMWRVHVTLTGTMTKQVKLFAALTEDHILYDNKLAYGNPTSGEWNDIFRAMISGANGSETFTLSGTKEFDFSADLTDQDWNASNLHVVAFIQDVTASAPSSFQVEGLGKQPLGSAGVVSADPNSQFRITPTVAGFRVVAPARGPVQVRLTDVLGRIVSLISIPNLDPGVNSIEQASSLEGAYLVTLLSNDRTVASCKLIR